LEKKKRKKEKKKKKKNFSFVEFGSFKLSKAFIASVRIVIIFSSIAEGSFEI